VEIAGQAVTVTIDTPNRRTIMDQPRYTLEEARRLWRSRHIATSPLNDRSIRDPFTDEVHPEDGPARVIYTAAYLGWPVELLDGDEDGDEHGLGQ
jgi:hypothetical protein